MGIVKERIKKKVYGNHQNINELIKKVKQDIELTDRKLEVVYHDKALIN